MRARNARRLRAARHRAFDRSPSPSSPRTFPSGGCSRCPRTGRGQPAGIYADAAERL